MVIYKTINLITNKIYIGKQVKFKLEYLGSGKLIKLSIKKYGKENFKKEILQTCSSIEELNIQEQYWIKHFNSIVPNGYNISLGGDGGDTISKNPNKNNIIKKQLQTKKTNKVNFGEKNPMFGTHLSVERKTKMSKKLKFLYETGKIKRYRMTKEGKKKLSEYMIKNCPTKTPEGRLKNRLNNLGSKNPNSNTYEFISPTGDKIIVIGGIKDFCKNNNLSYKKIIKVFRNELNDCNGWLCKKLGKSKNKT